ncbi:MAG TPA: ATP-binding protein [Gammaproteobacteria bacterium]|nr:ATP-binding protein [Gammaproteobacteria bacterium]
MTFRKTLDGLPNEPVLSLDELRQPLPADTEEARQIQADRWARAVTDAGIAKRFASTTFDAYRAPTPKQAHVLEACRAYADEFEARRETGAGMILCGGVGTGKTMLASAIGLTVLRAGYSVALVSVLGLLRQIRDTYRRDSGATENAIIQRFASVDLLVLDEVGVQRGTDDELIQIFEILNARYNDVRPTLLLSNLTLTELRRYIGERVIDRMREDGGKLLIFDWDSARGRS